MATFNKLQLRREQSIQIAAVGQIQFFQYATEATESEVLTAGWFNNARDQLTVGSIIEAIVDDELDRVIVEFAKDHHAIPVTSSKPTFA